MKNLFKRVTSAVLLFAMVLGLLGGIPFPSSSAAEPQVDANGNVIVNLMEGLNADFEEFSIPGWSVMTGISQSDEQLYGAGSTWALKLSDTSSKGSLWSISDKNAIEAEKKYKISAQVYGGIGQMTVFFYDAEGKELSDLTITMATEKAANE